MVSGNDIINLILTSSNFLLKLGRKQGCFPSKPGGNGMGAWRIVKSIVNSKYICSNQKGETWSNMTSVYAYSKKVMLCKRGHIFF